MRRDGHDLDRIRQYIFANPANWETDEYYVSPSAAGRGDSICP
jgi:hypothetical protein